MYSYALLEPGCHYLIQETLDQPILLIKVAVETDQCLFITKYKEVPELEWKKKQDPILDILECLTDAKVKEWQAIYNDGHDAFHEEEDDE